MNPRTVATIVLKCFGLWLLLIGLSGLSAAIQTAGISGESTGIGGPRELFLYQAVPSMFYLALALLCLVNTDLLLRWLFRELEGGPAVAAGTVEYQSIGIALLGAWVLAGAIPTFLTRALQILLLARGPRRLELENWWSAYWPELASVVIELALGLFLFLRSRRVAEWWTRAQSARSDGKAQEPPDE